MTAGTKWARCVNYSSDPLGPDLDMAQLIPMPAAGTYTLSFDFIDTQTAALSIDANRRAMIWLNVVGMNTGQVRDLNYAGATHQGTLLWTDGIGISGDFAEGPPNWGNLPPTTGWVHFSTSVDTTALQSSAYLLVDVSMYGNVPAGAEPRLGVDNVSLVPEPATMSLLGLGALALLRRRRA
jgi:hypothetical protein